MNCITRLDVYRTPEGAWVFDDESKGLVQEPFVAGIDTMFEMVAGGDGKVAILFSETGMPHPDFSLDWRREEWGGNWYFCNELGFEGWLCPALFKYFDVAPEKIYIKIVRD